MCSRLWGHLPSSSSAPGMCWTSERCRARGMISLPPGGLIAQLPEEGTPLSESHCGLARRQIKVWRQAFWAALPVQALGVG